MNVSVRESSLPGIGQRYEIDLSPPRQIVVVASRDGMRTISIIDTDDDAPSTTIQLTPDHAVTLGALLLGARCSIDTASDPSTDVDTVIVDTITIPENAPSIGRTPNAILDQADTEATILAVISDQTPELIEDDATRPLHAGDRIVVAARRDQFAEIVRTLTG